MNLAYQLVIYTDLHIHVDAIWQKRFSTSVLFELIGHLVKVVLIGSDLDVCYFRSGFPSQCLSLQVLFLKCIISEASQTQTGLGSPVQIDWTKSKQFLSNSSCISTRSYFKMPFLPLLFSSKYWNTHTTDRTDVCLATQLGTLQNIYNGIITSILRINHAEIIMVRRELKNI